MSNTDLLTCIAMTIGAFLVGRITYTPERWVEDRMKEIERKMFDRLTGFFEHKLDMMKSQISSNIETMTKSMSDLQLREVATFSASSMDEMAKKVYQDFKKRGFPEDVIKREIMGVLKIGEEAYERIIKDLK